ncbi:MAG: PAS domain-containing protein [Alphaproteobacteria bacterium]|nr:PAS domain-containing protein [Alphaproteobacteria bacterium]
MFKTGSGFDRMFDYWIGLKGDQALPAYHAIDPIEIPWALANLYVVERKDDGMFRYRLVGEAVQAKYRVSLKGRTLHDFLEKETADRTVATWEEGLRSGLVRYTHSRHYRDVSYPICGRRLLMPFADRDGRARFILGYVEFTAEMRSLVPLEAARTEIFHETWIDAEGEVTAAPGTGAVAVG